MLLTSVASTWTGCTVDAAANPNRCRDGDTCPADRYCVRPDGLGDEEPGFCVLRRDASMDSGVVDAGGDPPDTGPPDAGPPDAGCDISAPESCGACGTPCRAAEPNCESDGSGGFHCVATCPIDECLDRCVDRATDEENCGGCGVTCAVGEFCIAGQCLCGGEGGPECEDIPSSTCCAGACVDIRSSNVHCGACSAGCPGGATCTMTQCKCGSVVDCRLSTCLAATNLCL